MIRVIIERFIAETLEANYEDVAKNTLQKAVRAPGFISGESLKDMANPRHRVLLCNWRSLAEWSQWHDSAERKEMMDQMNLMLEKEEKITILEMP